MGEWIRTWGGPEPPPEPRQAWANRSANRSVDGAEMCEALGRPYAAALSPLPCRRALPVLAVMWFASLVAASLLCASCTVSACSERRYSSDQRWEQAVAEEVEKLLSKSEDERGPDFEGMGLTPRESQSRRP